MIDKTIDNLVGPLKLFLNLQECSFYIYNQRRGNRLINPINVDLSDNYEVDELYLQICPNFLDPEQCLVQYPQLVFYIRDLDSLQRARR